MNIIPKSYEAAARRKCALHIDIILMRQSCKSGQCQGDYEYNENEVTLPPMLAHHHHIKCKMSNSSHVGGMFNCLWRTQPLALHYLLALTVGGLLLFTPNVCGATASHKEHHHTRGLYDRNNFTDMQIAALVEDVKAADTGFSAESSVILPGSKSSSGCPPTTSSHCLRCNNDGCVKCPMYLVTDTRQCVDQCPSGYLDQWSAHTEFMGRVCVSMGYSGPLMAAMAGLLGGFLVCFSLLAVGVMVVRRKRRRKAIKQKLINDNTIDRADFLRQLNELRPNAEYFLAMLNDTRRQIRKLYLSGEVAAANSYRPIVRDLAKMLILLNRPIELIPAAPHDWSPLYTWALQALDRYKPQVGQLIDFFQSPLSNAEEFEVLHYAQKGLHHHPKHQHHHQQQHQHQVHHGHGSLRSALNLHAPATTAAKMHLFGSLISLHEFEEPRATDPFGSSFNTLIGGSNMISDLNASSLWLEDEFYRLGSRPQDVITTEL